MIDTMRTTLKHLTRAVATTLKLIKTLFGYFALANVK